MREEDATHGTSTIYCAKEVRLNNKLPVGNRWRVGESRWQREEKEEPVERVKAMQ